MSDYISFPEVNAKTYIHIWINYLNKYVKRPNIYWRRHVNETFSTSHTNMLLQKQYCEEDFKKYYDLISCHSCLNETTNYWWKNHQSNPAGLIMYSLKWMQYHRGLNMVNVVIIIDPTTTKMQVTTRSGRITKTLILKMSVFLSYFDFGIMFV